MIEVRYKDRCEFTDLSCHTVAEVRKQFKEALGIPDNTVAKLNGKRIKRKCEGQTCLNDDDGVTFVNARNNGLILMSASLLALALCGAWFAYGYTTSSTSLSVILAEGDFVDVTVNNSSPLSWTLMASSYGTTGNGTLFDINTATSNYTGDMIATVYHTNAYELIDVYRYLNMKLAIFDSAGNVLDINDDGSANISSDYALLTLKNGTIDMYIAQTDADIYTVKVIDGYYLCHPTWTAGHESPILYCEVLNK